MTTHDWRGGINNANILYVIDGYNNKVITSFVLEGGTTSGPVDISINPSTSRIYITNSLSDSIIVMDGRRNSMLNTSNTLRNNLESDMPLITEKPSINVSNSVVDIAVNPVTNKFYVADVQNTIFVIDGNRDHISNIIRLPTPISDIDVNVFSNTIVALNKDHTTIFSIDGKTNAIITNTTLDGFANDLDANVRIGKAYIIFNPSNISATYIAFLNDNDVLMTGLDLHKLGSLISDPDLTADPTTGKIYVLNRLGGQLIETRHLSNGYEEIPVSIELEHFTRMVVNPDTKLIYAVSNKGTVFEIDPLLDTITRNFTTLGEASDIALNPKKNLAYVTNTDRNSVSVINLTSYKIIKDIEVDSNPLKLAVNPITDIVYLTFAGSNAISIINGTTNSISTGVFFNVNPPASGFIECNGQEVSNKYVRYNIPTKLECIAKAKDGFNFNYWAGNEDSGRIDKPVINMGISKFSNVTANFKEFNPPIQFAPINFTIPPRTLFEIFLAVFTAVVGILIPSIAGFINKHIQKRDLIEYMNKINSAYNNKQHLQELSKDISKKYAEGKLNLSNYEILDKKISNYLEELKRS
jgi:YVTN family beta-propeller protein